MGIDTKKKIQSGEIKLRKRSYVLVPKRIPSLPNGIDRNSNDNKEGISGSTEGVNQVLVRGAGDIYYYSGDDYKGTDFIIHQLTIGCIYLIAGKAAVNWPGTKAAHPSPKVQVARTVSRPFLPGHEALFPFFVETNLWHNAIVPILKDMSINLGSPLNRCTLDRSFESYILMVKGVVANSLRDYKFIP